MLICREIIMEFTITTPTDVGIEMKLLEMTKGNNLLLNFSILLYVLSIFFHSIKHVNQQFNQKMYSITNSAKAKYANIILSTLALKGISSGTTAGTGNLVIAN